MKSLEIIRSTNGVISTKISGLFNERLIVAAKNDIVISNDVYGNVLDAGLFGKKKEISFNYGYAKDGFYIAVYDILNPCMIS